LAYRLITLVALSIGALVAFQDASPGRSGTRTKGSQTNATGRGATSTPPVPPQPDASGPRNTTESGSRGSTNPVTGDANAKGQATLGGLMLRKYCGTLRLMSADRSMIQLADIHGEAVTTAGKQSCDAAPMTAIPVQIQSQALKDGLAQWKDGDRVIATVAISKSGDAETANLQDMVPQVFHVGGWKRPATFFTLPAIVLILTLFSKNVRELLFIGQDGRVSNSITQMSLWFILLISTYVSAFILRWTDAGGVLGCIGIPMHLAVLSGLSGLTTAGAKGITANKVANAPAPPANAQNGKWNDNKAAASLGDLIRDDNNRFDFGDFQMLVMTLIAVVSYGIIAYAFLGAIPAQATISLPDVDGTVLAMFGVGQGAYLTKKAATGLDQ